MKIGSHVSMSAPDYLLGSALETLSYNANALMLYSGAPQNTRRSPIGKLKIEEFHQCLRENEISLDDVIVHAPYIINLANTIDESKSEFAQKFLIDEIERVKQIGAKYLVLHPGSHVKAGSEIGLKQVVSGLNKAMENVGDVYIALETMAGKGSEVGRTFEELAFIIDNCKYSEHLVVCLDTCHVNDAGYDVSDFDALLDEFDRVIGLDKLKVIHLNDSKNPLGAHKDRHANIGQGEIGFENLCNIAHNERVKDIPKILETPYIDGKAPYKEEIEMLRNKQFINIID